MSQARLHQDHARDALIKARLTIHSFRKELVDDHREEGLAMAAKDLMAGQNALAEGNHRRRRLSFALLFLVMTVVGLFLYIQQIECEPRRSRRF